jgi:hypothetical protein
MTNAEFQMTKEIQSPNFERKVSAPFRHSSFDILSKFVIRVSSFASVCSALASLALALGIGANMASGSGVQNWPRFRGPNGSGV